MATAGERGWATPTGATSDLTLSSRRSQVRLFIGALIAGITADVVGLRSAIVTVRGPDRR
jgi:hypothetical protein